MDATIVRQPLMSGLITDVPPLHAWGHVTWWPLRRELGVTSFGINAFSADDGEAVIIAHQEDDGDRPRAHGSHEELYIVLHGRARFTVDGIEADAPAGTYVYVADPAADRTAVAEAPGTVVLVIGGKTGKAFTPSPWEFAAASVPPARAGDYDPALEITYEGLRVHPGNARLTYETASLEARKGDVVAALAHLREAVALEPTLAAVAAEDPDFGGLRSYPAFPRRAD